MPEITGVRERGNRAIVRVDGEPWAEIDVLVASDRGVVAGAVFTQDELDELRVEGERAIAMGRAVNLIGYRPRSEKEVRDRLLRYGHTPATIEEVIAKLLELEYLDDHEFARVMGNQKARKYGPRRVSMELKRAGLSEEIVESVVNEEFTEESETEAAREAASRRYNRESGSDAEARRVYGFLARRGYSTGVCAEIARDYREGSDASSHE